MMNTLIAIFTLIGILIASGGLAAAQDQTKDSQKKDRGVVDILNRILGGKQNVKGAVVSAKDSTLIVRGDDDRTYVVNTAGVDSATTEKLKPGQAVTVAAGTTGQNGVIIASSIEPGAEGTKQFHAVNGTVTSAGTSTITFKTRDGIEIPMDLSQIVGPPPRVRAREPATLIYEQSRQTALAPVWIEPSSATSTGSTSTGSASPTTTGSSTAGSDRIHGYVESIGVDTLTLKTDDGRMVAVDTSRAKSDDARPGDTVTVIGRAGSGSDKFVAEQIQKSR
jgi:hypothetical protein